MHAVTQAPSIHPKATLSSCCRQRLDNPGQCLHALAHMYSSQSRAPRSTTHATSMALAFRESATDHGTQRCPRFASALDCKENMMQPTSHAPPPHLCFMCGGACSIVRPPTHRSSLTKQVNCSGTHGLPASSCKHTHTTARLPITHFTAPVAKTSGTQTIPKLTATWCTMQHNWLPPALHARQQRLQTCGAQPIPRHPTNCINCTMQHSWLHQSTTHMTTADDAAATLPPFAAPC